MEPNNIGNLIHRPESELPKNSSNRKKILIAAGAVVLIGLASYLVFKKEFGRPLPSVFKAQKTQSQIWAGIITKMDGVGFEVTTQTATGPDQKYFTVSKDTVFHKVDLTKNPPSSSPQIFSAVKTDQNAVVEFKTQDNINQALDVKLPTLPNPSPQDNLKNYHPTAPPGAENPKPKAESSILDLFPIAQAFHLGGSGSYAGVNISIGGAKSGESPNGYIRVDTSTTGGYNEYYWGMWLYGQIGTGAGNEKNTWVMGYGTGKSASFDFYALGAGNYTVGGDAQMWWWNGSSWVYWATLSGTGSTYNIPNPPPPPPPAEGAVSITATGPDNTVIGDGGTLYMDSGQSATITWLSNEASSCSIDECPASLGNCLNLSPSGSGSTGVLNSGPHQYTASCIPKAGYSGIVPHTVAVKIKTKCSPSSQNTWTGNNINFTGTGGDGSYSWSASGASPSSGSSANFTTKFNSTGTKLVGVISDNMLVGCGVDVYDPPTVDLKINNSNNDLNLTTGQSATLSWTVSGATYCTATSAWSGNKSVISGSSESTGTYTSAGDYGYGLTCGNPAGSVYDNVSVHVTPPPFDYSLSNDGDITVTQGQSGPTTIFNTVNSGSGSVSFSASGLPSGATGSFNLSSCAQDCFNKFTISTTASMPVGTYPITVTGSPLSKTTKFNLKVNALSSPFDYSLSNDSDKTVTQGQSVTNTITATKTSGTTQSVSLSTISLPGGMTSDFSTTSCNPTCSNTLTINTGTAAPGTYTITVNGVSTGLGDKTTKFDLIVNPSPLSVSCSSNLQTAVINQDVTWSAVVSGGNNNYTYKWGGDAPLNNQTVISPKIKYFISGTKKGSVEVTSGKQKLNVDCANTVTVYAPTLAINPASATISQLDVTIPNLPDTPPPAPKPAQFSGVPNVNIDSCAEITTSGNYTLKNDITSSQICLNIHDTSNVYIDCKGHSINTIVGSGWVSDKGSVKIKNVNNFVLNGCALNLATDSNDHPFVIRSSNNGNITNNTSNGGDGTTTYIDVDHSNNLNIASNYFRSIYQQNYSSNNTIQNNTISGNLPVASAVIVSNFGSNNKIIKNNLDGKSNDNYYDQVGADDGIAIADENGDVIQNNIIKNNWDCGIETTGFISNFQITGNYIKNAPFCGIGAWYWSSWLGNTVSGNIFDNVGTLFYFFRAYAFRIANAHGLGLPAETALYFKDNVFSDNKLISLRYPHPFSNVTVNSFFYFYKNPITATDNQQKSISVNDFILGNNRFTNNDFGTSVAGPWFRDAADLAVDGGGNICKLNNDPTTNGLSCSSAPPGAIQLQAVFDPDGPTGPAQPQQIAILSSWSSSNSQKASVDNSSQKGLVKGNSPGAATITADYIDSYGNNVSGSAPITVSNKPNLSVSLLSNPDTGYQTFEAKLDAYVTSNVTGQSTNYSFWWNCNNPSTSVSAVNGDSACGGLPGGVAGQCVQNSSGAKCDGINSDSESIKHVYSGIGEYIPKVITERGAAPPAEDRFNNGGGIVVQPPANDPPSVSAQSPQAPVDYCQNPFNWTLGWNFSDPGQLQSAYQLTITDTSTGQIITDTGKINSDSGSYAIPLGVLAFNKTYSWTIKVWDNDGWNILSSSAVSGSNFTTIQHAAPAVLFNWIPTKPSKGEQVTFTDNTVTSGGATKSTWQWTFPSDATIVNGSTSSSTIAVKFDAFSTLPGSKIITLRVTDSTTPNGLSCQKTTGEGGIPVFSIGRGIPKFKEILPR